MQNNTDPRINAPTVGKVLLRSRGFFTDDYMFWVCIGALVAFSILFNVLFIAALTYLNRKLFCFSFFCLKLSFRCERTVGLMTLFLYNLLQLWVIQELQCWRKMMKRRRRHYMDKWHLKVQDFKPLCFPLNISTL